jgi:DNA-binding HxlR family transcriptional regulator
MTFPHLSGPAPACRRLPCLRNPPFPIIFIATCKLQVQDTKLARSAPSDFRSGCPIASSLDLVGDRWTLVILRDLANGKSKFREFLDSPERIATNILTARLSQMEQDGLVKAELYEQRPRRYAYKLTPKGAALIPVLQAISRWGCGELPNRWTPPERFMKLKPKDLA